MTERLHLVSCSSVKLDRPAPAEELYCSHRFKLTRAIVKNERWAIISAKHGLVAPATIVAPYDDALVGKPKAWRLAWSARVLGELAELPAADVYVIWAGRSYWEFLAPSLRAELPLQGLGIGQQLAYLTRRSKAPAGLVR